MNNVWRYIAMGKTIRVLAFLIILFLAGCVSNPVVQPPADSSPVIINETNSPQYQKDDLWCRQFGTFGNSQEMYNETYKKCMERFGYKF
jgi:hypothetical protein